MSGLSSKYLKIAESRLHKRSRKLGMCLIYTGALTSKGYGSIKIRGKVFAAHRLSYEVNNGKIPRGLFVLHSCDRRPCIEPKHLRVGTYKDNSEDMWRRLRNKNSPAYKNKMKTHCRYGHRFTKENTIVPYLGARNCRECHRRIDRNSKRKLT